MSIFHWLRGSDREPELSPALRQRLDDLEAANRANERKLKALELDWSEWFDKFRLLYARLSKRIREAAAAVGNPDGDGPQSAQDAPESTNVLPMGYGQPPHVVSGPKTRRNY